MTFKRWKMQVSGLLTASLLVLVPTTVVAQNTPLLTPQMLAEAEALERNYPAKVYLADLRRVQQVGYAVLRAAASFCADRRYSIGAPVLALDAMPTKLQEGAVALLQLKQSAQRVWQLVPDGPLARSGVVKEGDELLNLSDKADARALAVNWFVTRPDAVDWRPTLLAKFKRQNETFTVELKPQELCNVELQLRDEGAVTATLENKRLTLTTGLLRQTKNDDELALVLANLLAHGLLRDGVKDFPTTPADKPVSLRAQVCADYLSVYFLGLAKFDLTRPQEFWSRLALQADSKYKAGLVALHPVSVERVARLQQAFAEVREKKDKAYALLPERERLPADLPASWALLTHQAGAPHPEAKAEIVKAQVEDERLLNVDAVPWVKEAGKEAYKLFLAETKRPRAFVVGRHDEDGKSSWEWRTGRDAVMVALMDCSIRVDGAPCYVYALNESVVWNPENLTRKQSLSPAALRLAAVPLRQSPTASGFANVADLNAVPIDVKAHAEYKAFLDKPAPRALVVTGAKTALYWLGKSALDDALSYCERLDEPCWLYAVDDKVVWQRDQAKRISRRNQLPVISDVARLN